MKATRKARTGTRSDETQRPAAAPGRPWSPPPPTAEPSFPAVRPFSFINTGAPEARAQEVVDRAPGAAQAHGPAPEVVQRCKAWGEFQAENTSDRFKDQRLLRWQALRYINYLGDVLKKRKTKKNLQWAKEVGTWLTECSDNIDQLSIVVGEFENLVALLKAPVDDKKEEKEVKKDKGPSKEIEVARNTSPDLGGRFKEYNKDLQFDGCVTYIQWVPATATSINLCLASGNIMDAVYNTEKAFWLSNPAKYKLSDTTGKVRMEYTFSGGVSKSLQEDYLLCATGDYDEDNPEKWAGETAHPNHSLWKTSELGARGIGYARLKQLASGVTRIDVTDGKGNSLASKYPPLK